MAESVDASDLKSDWTHLQCQFKSGSGHHPTAPTIVGAVFYIEKSRLSHAFLGTSVPELRFTCSLRCKQPASMAVDFGEASITPIDKSGSGHHPTAPTIVGAVFYIEKSRLSHAFLGTSVPELRFTCSLRCKQPASMAVDFGEASITPIDKSGSGHHPTAPTIVGAVYNNSSSLLFNPL